MLAERERPPLERIRQRHWMSRTHEERRARTQHRRIRVRIEPGLWRVLRDGDVAGGGDECLKISVRDRRFVDPEAIHGHTPCRSFFRIVLVRAHPEHTPFDVPHSLHCVEMSTERTAAPSSAPGIFPGSNGPTPGRPMYVSPRTR
jgi:hypothetical protein